MQPFHADKTRRMDIVNRSYYPLRGPAWTNISDSAKSLVAGMLKKDPKDRLNVHDVLSHDWLGGSAPDKSLGEDYVKRIKHLALRSQLKKCFLAGQMEETHKKRKASLREELPFLGGNVGKGGSGGSSDSGGDDNYDCVSSSLGAIYVGEAFSTKLRELKNMLVNTIYGNRAESIGKESSSEEMTPMHRNKRMRLGFDGDVDFDVYCGYMCSCDLDVLATPRVFSIFDTNGDGNICMREFLMTIIAMREMGSDRDDVEAAQLYFRMFDIDEGACVMNK